MQVTNTSKAPQGIHTLSGVAYVAPGDTVDLDLNQNQADAVRILPFITLNGDVTEGEPVASFLETIDVPANEVDQLRQEVVNLKAELRIAQQSSGSGDIGDLTKADVDKLQADLEGQQAENKRLASVIADRDAELAKLKEGKEETIRTPQEVLAMASDANVPFMSFKAAAAKLLGDKTPSKKDEIVAALEELATQP